MMAWKMGRCGFVILLAAVIAAACSTNTGENESSMTRHVLVHDGLEREYFVYLPSAYDGQEQYPAVLFMHGYGGSATGTEAEVTQGLNAYAEKFGYVMVYPQGSWFMAGDSIESQWEVTSWNHISDGFDEGPDGPICTADVKAYPCPPECGSCGRCGWTSCNDDVGFIRSLAVTVTEDLGVDSVSVAGFSNGAMMANRIACEASDLFSAVALVGGRVEPGFECTPTVRLPLLQINGGRDFTVPLDGSPSHEGYLYAKTTSVTGHWTDGDVCSAPIMAWTSKAIEDKNVQCEIACGGTGHPAIDCIWPDGGHRWPGTADILGSNGYCVTELQSASMPEQTICVAPDPDAEFWGSELLFSFFNQYRADGKGR